ncbi:hypothetical protein [uncultured Planktomarina sp.]
MSKERCFIITGSPDEYHIDTGISRNNPQMFLILSWVMKRSATAVDH